MVLIISFNSGNMFIDDSEICFNKGSGSLSNGNEICILK